MYREELSAWEKSGGKGAFPGLKDKSMEEIRCAVIDANRFASGSIEKSAPGLPREVQELANRIGGELAALDVSHVGSLGMANVVNDDEHPRNASILIRGQAQNPGPEVPRSFLEVLSHGVVKPFTNGSGRLELAEAIASPANPLTHRVIMNRVWLHHFGEGLIPTPDDLGVQSDPPVNPALLDWLASNFIKDGWSLKKMHRSILLSRTWQQASEPNAAMAKIDPFNRLLWRQNVRKLEFEALRDSILFMGGQLDLTIGGRPVNIESEPYSQRRSIYGFIDRNEMAEFMRHFDVANPTLPTGRRFTTIVPQQALFRMNSMLVIEQARNIINRKDFHACKSDEERVRQLYEIIYQRWPKPTEMSMALTYIHGHALDDGEHGLAPPIDPISIDPVRMTKAQRIAHNIALKKAKRMEMKNGRKGTAGIKEAVRDPLAEKVDRSPLTGWEKYAHALLMTNEMSYVN